MADRIVNDIYQALALQVGQIDSSPTVLTDRVYAYGQDDLPAVTIELGNRDNLYPVGTDEALWNKEWYELDIMMQLRVGKKAGENLSLTIYKLADEIWERLYRQTQLLRRQVHGFAWIAENGLSDIDYANQFEIPMAVATASFTVRYERQNPR